MSIGATLRPLVSGVASGFTLPLRLVADVFREATLRRRYVKVVVVQAVLVVLVTGLLLESEARDIWRTRAHHALFLAKVYGHLVGVETVVIALSRDFHDQLGRLVSIHRGLPPEDPEARPRVRINWGWIKKKIKRKVRGAWFYAAGLPLVAVLSWPISFVSDVASYTFFSSVWGFMWLVIFMAAKTGFAWNDVAAPPPWFLRMLQPLERVPAVGWYPRLLGRTYAPMFSPMGMVERAPEAFIGLAVFRAVSALPLVYLVLRPLFPVASATILKERGLLLPAATEPVPPALPEFQSPQT
jgi:hypothetical protein